jgi:hypothetical protein
MTSQNAGNLELFETEFLMEFPNITVTAIVDYIIGKNKSLIITGDKGGVIRLYEREGSKLVQKSEKQIGKSKIDKLISNAESKNLYILTNGNLFIYGLPDLTPFLSLMMMLIKTYLKTLKRLLKMIVLKIRMN